NDDLDNFVYVASHDLLSPLASIEQSIEVMNHLKVSGDDLNKILNVINTSIKKFRSLVTDMGTIGKIEHEKMEIVDVSEILDNVEWSLDDKIKAAGAVISRDLEINQVLFSKNNLRSILFNLIANAIKFKSDRPPVINIRSTQEGDNVVLSVQDNGIGISKTDLNKVFDLYGRLHHDIEGQGIGLYLANKIVHSIGGKITVESNDGNGARFSIYFKTEQKVLSEAVGTIG
ncbi:MAG: HAMP domain-containing sensor histidine kinase, partial [Ferruginibacter sp.]